MTGRGSGDGREGGGNDRAGAGMTGIRGAEGRQAGGGFADVHKEGTSPPEDGEVETAVSAL